ncbi:unnamed protein product, partial [Amoebophrya sp. A120]
IFLRALVVVVYHDVFLLRYLYPEECKPNFCLRHLLLNFCTKNFFKNQKTCSFLLNPLKL